MVPFPAKQQPRTLFSVDWTEWQQRFRFSQAPMCENNSRRQLVQVLFSAPNVQKPPSGGFFVWGQNKECRHVATSCIEAGPIALPG